jgi:endonuclease/exonuclease/phosphatase family metal-dependent hydrolase
MTDSCRAVDTPASREAEAVGTLVGTHRRIDHIFVAEERFHVREAGLLAPPHRGVSDHVGYYADVGIKV